MAESFHFIVPAPPPAEFFAPHQLAQEFRHEVAYRDDFQDYCRWYRATAAQHRQELARMRGDWNVFGWFVRGRR
ncbi:hypothetical protein [Spirulina major]|uniref:hypothetical protein n=1 Tax=Spirulina major TaxID=270636 RepID=UPI0009350D36|nr:hypothetical protein [Spirulina major]